MVFVFPCNLQQFAIVAVSVWAQTPKSQKSQNPKDCSELCSRSIYCWTITNCILCNCCVPCANVETSPTSLEFCVCCFQIFLQESKRSYSFWQYLQLSCSLSCLCHLSEVLVQPFQLLRITTDRFLLQIRDSRRQSGSLLIDEGW